MGYSGFAMSDVSAKFLTDSYTLFPILFYISVCCCAFMLCLSPMLGGFQKIGQGKAKIHLFRSFMNFMVSVCVVIAFAHLPLATIYTMIFAKPLIATLMSVPLYGEKLNARQLSIILVGFTGILIAMRPSPETFDIYMLLPLAAALFSASMWIASKSLEGENTFNMAIFPFLGTGLLSLGFMLSLDGTFIIPAPEHIINFAICGCGVMAGVIGLSLAFRNAPSSTVSPFHYVQMVWGLVFGYLIFNDVPDHYTIAGAALIISSGLFLIFSESRNAEKP